MLSICIPIFNYNVCDLVNALSDQINQLSAPAEIVLIDDCSSEVFRKENEKCCNTHNYIKLKKNIGRSAIRNLFLKYTRYNYLLFLDCDSLIISDNFLKNYIIEIESSKPEIICGGRVYDSKKPDRSRLLRWKYGIKKESKPALIRSKKPNASFMTNNFVINRELFETLQFDERLLEYGHEDTLFGFELKKRGIEILHIENAILNGDLENNMEYLDKTEKAVCNLKYVLEFTNSNPGLIEDITLLRIFFSLKNYKPLISILFTLMKPVIYYSLSHGYVSIPLFDFYKLGLLNRTLSSD
ncbi:glycosyltransferase family 2 protein [Saccharicrinis sp. FJH2]|uniref:glycosyltransferase family 2 protein n=1 Tax=Saccharicrinis sp. FJH65 TaxID=3344659 RepID=UPI0035F2D4E7